MNTLKNLLTEEELLLYERTEYPFNLSILHTALKQKLKEDPGYEVWVPLVYYQCVPYLQNQEEPSVIKPYKFFISNKGNICSLRKKTPAMISQWSTDKGYLAVTVRLSGKKTSLLVHRALACSFVPLDEFLLKNEQANNGHPKDLQVNHIDGVKINYCLTNLEWCTALDNVKHAWSTGLAKPNFGVPGITGIDNVRSKPIKGVVTKGRFKGHAFMLIGVKECAMYGFTQPNVSACVAGKNKSHKNCVWSFASEEEIGSLPRGIGKEIMEELESMNPLLRAA